MKSIQTKLMILVTSLIILVSLGEGIVNMFLTRTALENQAMQSLQLQTEELNNLLSESEKSVDLLREQALDSYDNNIRNQVENAISLVNSFYQQTQDGILTETKAKSEALRSLRNIVYGENGYFWIDDTEYNLVLLPPSPQQEGIYRGNATDQNGTQYAKLFVDGALQGNDNFVDYYFPKPGDDTIAYQKRGYTKLFEPWGWVIGTGNYVDDIEAAISQYEEEMKENINASVTKLGEHGGAGVLSADGILQYFNDPKAIGTKIEVVDLQNGEDVVKKIVETKNDFLTYEIQNPITGQTQKEISYVHYDEDQNRFVFISKAEEHIYQGASKSVFNTIIVIVIGVILAFAATYYAARGFARPILQIQRVSEEISSGNLSVPKLTLKSKDEIGRLAQSTNIMIEKVKEMIMQAADISRKVSSSSEELTASANEMRDSIEQVSATSEEIASGATSQASDATETLEKVRSAAEQMEMMTSFTFEMKQNSDKANLASQHGLKSVDQSMQQIQMIEERVSETARVIQSLSEKSKDINHILSVIHDISNQTNLLALNAAIEAARAGEHGKGFAVVADEVRKLAEETSSSTKQIFEIITAVENESEQAGQSMAAMVSEVNVGMTVIEGNKDAFHEIREAISQLTERIMEVTILTEKNADNMTDILKLVENIAAVTEESSAGTEQLSATMEEQNASVQQISSMASELSSLVDELNKTISKFNY
nr:cache domain-containing protein [Bacillus dakarensis]